MEQRFNVKMVNSPPPTSFYQSQVSSVVKQRMDATDPSRLFYDSKLPDRRTNFADVSLAKSGFFNQGTALYESTVKNGIGRGIGCLPEERLRKIAKDFISLYGGSEISRQGLTKIQRQAYEKCSQKPELNEETVNELSKCMDQNRDNRVTEEDILSLCRRYLSCEKRPIAYSPIVEERLAVARRLFKQFDVEKKGYLTQKQVPNLLSQTYKALGKSFQATEEDVKSWMRLADGDGDGHVTLPEYERSIIRALKKQGIKIYDE